jgi:hypothetical protein
VHIGAVEAIPKEGKTMTKLTTRFMIATAALVVVAGAASAQTMTASIPFEFRAGNLVMAAGTYYIENLRSVSGVPLFRVWNRQSHGSIVLLPQAPVDPEKGWAEGQGKLAFACISGRCALAEIYTGSESHAYTFRGPKLGKDETAVLRVIPMQPGKGE